MCGVGCAELDAEADANGSSFTRDGPQFFLTDTTIGVPLRNLDRFAAPLIGEQRPDSPAAGHGEQPQLAFAGFALQKL
jgi:hypothetical protein